MLRELPDRYTNDNPDYDRWQFEAARAEWESEQGMTPDVTPLTYNREEEDSNMIRVSVDEEFGDGYWWSFALKDPNRPVELIPLLEGQVDEVLINGAQYSDALAWAESIPGWNEGTEFASHPLLFNEEE